MNSNFISRNAKTLKKSNYYQMIKTNDLQEKLACGKAESNTYLLDARGQELTLI